MNFSRRRLLLLGCAIPLLGLLAWAHHSGVLHELGAHYRRPILDAVLQVDLGRRERGETATAVFPITNRGMSELVITDFRSSCACMDVAWDKGGRTVRAEEIRVPPGQSTQLSVRLRVIGAIGLPMRDVVWCRSNDPDAPSPSFVVDIERVTGGVVTFPTQVLLPPLRSGAEVRPTLEVRELGETARKIKRVSTSNPAIVAARLVPLETPVPSGDGGERGLTIAHIELSVKAPQPGPLREQVIIELDEPGRAPDVVPVVGNVSAVVEVTPSTLTLPRPSGMGPLYHAQCICRSSMGDDLILQVVDKPEDFSVAVEPVSESASRKLVRIACLNPSAPRKEVQSHRVRLRGTAGNEAEDVVIEVRLFPPASPASRE